MKGRTVRVVVNQDMCVGNGVCEAVVPDLFAVGDDGTAEVLLDEVPANLAGRAAEAVSSCPAQALRLENG
ncbi:ferredoxin [Nocardia sp. XZ_19_385]|uniref:ferredoxin n=1 Tax=Nocardia sp. XZ_19_385 TaxID=2769488 RepID=UPI001E487E4C|nr:ferredoxin [Nocardia sp. XZ_19_385]